ncbi:hypothetical protein ACH5RR_011950 [Cinchona calisaya]|uniref:Uncharacterized protein n=1 Tax=Cinchona calisaya TaxID=153742 RepID=A0ABD3A6D8_9GENT
MCEDDVQGKKLLNEAISTLFSLPVSGNSDKNSTDHQCENIVTKVKPTLLWSAVYVQELTVGVFDGVSSTSMPDGNLQYNNLLGATTKLFQKMYSDEEFFPET